MGIPARDHLGNEYPCLKAMAAAWGVNYDTFHHRLVAGWGIMRALAAPPRRRGVPGGREAVIMERMARGWDEKEARRTRIYRNSRNLTRRQAGGSWDD